MKRMKRQGGFTIIETSMFLAISASLIFLTLGLNVLVARQRFNDTMNSLRTTLQSEYEEVRSGINTRLGGASGLGGTTCSTVGGGTTGAAGTSKCLALGTLIQFNTDLTSTPNKNSIKISYIVGAGPSDGTIDSASTTLWPNGWPNNDSVNTLSDMAALVNTKLWVVGNSSSYNVWTTDATAQPRTVKLQWGGEFVAGWNWTPGNDSSQKSVQALAILRSPVSSAIMVVPLSNTNPVSTTTGVVTLPSTGTGAAATINTLNTPMAFIINNVYPGLPGAAICIDAGAISQAVRLVMPATPSEFTLPVTPSVSKLGALCG